VVEVIFDPNFKKSVKKIKDATVKEKIKKQIAKIIQNPEIGKPMRFGRKGTRELYVAPYRLSYASESDKIILLALYHKDEQ
jgi:mRNA-degrading endonuclease RelE of RelBE toxin-antitoxin system